MSDRQQKLDWGLALWWIPDGDDVFAFVVKHAIGRITGQQQPAVGLFTVTGSDESLEWEFTPDGWTPCDGHCTTYPECDTHVQCDDHCLALLHPETIEELHGALEHWRSHSVTSGCSHGC